MLQLILNNITSHRFWFFLAGFAFCLNSYSQTGIQTDTPDASSALEIYSTDKGLLIPRLSLSNDLSSPSPVNAPATGLIIYNNGVNQENGFYYWSGSIWKMIKPQKPSDMHGPDSSTDNAVARFDGTDGNLIQNSGVILDDDGNITGVNKITTAGFTMPTGAAEDKVLGSDASGNASWIDPVFPDVKEDDVMVVSDAQTFNFKGAVSVNNDGHNQASITVSENVSEEQVIQVSSSSSIDINILIGDPVAISWDNEFIKDASFQHSNTVNPSRIYVLTPGIYEVNYMFSFDNTNNKRKTIQSRVRINGNIYFEGSSTYGFIYSSTDDRASLVSSSFLLEVEEGDFIEVVVNGRTNEGAVNLIENENLLYIRAMRTW